MSIILFFQEMGIILFFQEMDIVERELATGINDKTE
jgi:hypothetical protein